MENIAQDLKKFIIDNFLFGEDNGLKESDSFLNKGIIDSTGMMELVTHLEKKYAIKIQDTELLPENLDSIDRLTQFIGRKKK